MTLTDPTRDGQHDFDFEIGSWRTELLRLVSSDDDGATWEVNWIAVDTRESE